MASKWLGGEKRRLTEIISRIKATVESVDMDVGMEAWPDLREVAASLVQSASQLQAQAAVLTIVDPTERAKEVRGEEPGMSELEKRSVVMDWLKAKRPDLIEETLEQWRSDESG